MCALSRALKYCASVAALRTLINTHFDCPCWHLQVALLTKMLNKCLNSAFHTWREWAMLSAKFAVRRSPFGSGSGRPLRHGSSATPLRFRLIQRARCRRVLPSSFGFSVAWHGTAHPQVRGKLRDAMDVLELLRPKHAQLVRWSNGWMPPCCTYFCGQLARRTDGRSARRIVFHTGPTARCHGTCRCG